MRNNLALWCIGLALASGCQSTGGPLARIPSLKASRVAKATLPGATSPATGVNDERMARARVLTDSGRADEALFVYSQVLAAEPRADAHHEMAVIHDKRGNFTESAAHYDEALKLEPKNADLLCDRGYSHFLQGDFEQAEKYYGMALHQQPGLPRVHNNMGLLLAQRGKIDSALGQFAAAGCTHAQARANLSYALMMSGELDAARYQLELARNSDETLPATQQLQLAMHQIAGGAPSRPAKQPAAPVAAATVPPSKGMPMSKPVVPPIATTVAKSQADRSSEPVATLSPEQVRERMIRPTVASAPAPSRDLATALVGGPVDVASPRRRRQVAESPVVASAAPATTPVVETTEAVAQTVAMQPTVPQTTPSPVTTPAAGTPAAGEGDANPLRDPSNFRFWR